LTIKKVVGFLFGMPEVLYYLGGARPIDPYNRPIRTSGNPIFLIDIFIAQLGLQKSYKGIKGKIWFRF
jgi:hypothetical protein